ncbi:MAG: LysM peptidoglycan-binding domain-containing protein [Desulfuromonadaceae bacterium]
MATMQKSPSQDGIIVQEIDVQKGDTLYDISRKFSGRGMYFPQILLFNTIHNPNLIYPGSKLKVPITQHVGNDEHAGPKPADKSDKPKAAGAKKAPPEIKSATPSRQSNAVPPVSHQNTEISLSELRSSETTKSVKISKSGHKKKPALPARKKTVPESEPSAGPRLSAPLPASYKYQASPPSTVDATTGQKLFEAAVKAYRVDDCRTALELLDRYLADNSGSALAADANLYKAECYLKLSAQ